MSTTSTRRCRRPGSGMSSGSSPRSCWPPAPTGCRDEDGRDAAVACAAQLSHAYAGLRCHGRAGHLVRAAGRQRFPRDAAGRPPGGAPQADRQGDGAQQLGAGVPKAGRGDRRQSRIHDTPPTIFHAEASRAAGNMDMLREALAQIPRDPARRPARSVRPLSAGGCGDQGRRHRQRRHACAWWR